MTKTILVGTLPPENAPFYFSNSSNTRLWDILKSIAEGKKEVTSGSNVLTPKEKEEILNKLKTGIYDIILEYDRDVMDSTKDKDIQPLKYSDLLSLAKQNQITKLLFVYKNAAKWFLHSLEKEKPKRVQRLKYEIDYGIFKTFETEYGDIKCILLPSPLNRGKKGETLDFKLESYQQEILI
ncbi:hypothetical protein [Psychroflexus aestuariivivens]|uniref:hypothetical protein n=1 Tax=Psychroflexus aestuariivivens TaxID=1795040 RepID=UPI000FDC019C|nr:hypothetical protein [Psychroflexus aestuariivivens]